jgi:hypothetical protein
MSEKSEAEVTNDNHSENQSYKQRKQSFKLTSNKATNGGRTNSIGNPYTTDGETG